MWVEKLAKFIALLGGFVLVGIALVSVISITGRAGVSFGFSSVLGDYELVEAGVAFAITCFFPLAQLKRAHAEVSFITEKMGILTNLIIDLIADFLMLIIALVLSWHLFLGTIDKYNYLETTFILQYPLYWAYGASLLGLFTWVIVAFYCVGRSVNAIKNHSLKSGVVS